MHFEIVDGTPREGIIIDKIIADVQLLMGVREWIIDDETADGQIVDGNGIAMNKYYGSSYLFMAKQ